MFGLPQTTNLCTGVQQTFHGREHPLAHRVTRRQHQQRVTHAARYDHAPFLDLQHLHRLRRADVPVVPVRELHLVGVRTVRPTARIRCLFAAEEEDVCNKLTFLQHPLATSLVLEPIACELPPRLRTIQVHAPASHRHTGQILVTGPRLMRKAVINDSVDAQCIDAVALRLDRERSGLPTPTVIGASGE